MDKFMANTAHPVFRGAMFAAPNGGGSDISRRRLLQVGGLLIGFAALGRPVKAHAAAISATTVDDFGNPVPFDGFAPGGFIRIGTDGAISLVAPNVEMGQGIYTAEAMLLAEELEVGLDQVQVVAAPPYEGYYKQALLGGQMTGGSTSIRGAWLPLRQAGASARAMLISAAAERWKVSARECSAHRAVVTHVGTGRTLSYGELAEAAAQLPVPQNVPLKPAGRFALIGTPAPRVDTPSKVNGSAIFGIDIVVPNLKIATVTACPVWGGTVATVDDSATRAVPGVRDVVRTSNTVAVIGDHFWAARQGLAALRVTWNEGAGASHSSPDIIAALKGAYGQVKPVSARHEGDIEGAFSSAAKTLSAEYELPFLAHATMEPINCTAYVRPDGCDIWCGTQVPTRAQGDVAKVTGLPIDKVAIHSQLLGGGFGRRLESEYVAQAAEIAKQVDYPVKIIWTREEDIQHDNYRPPYYDRISAALGADGMPTAWVDHVSGASVTSRYMRKNLGPDELDQDAVEGASEPPYAFPAISVDWTRQDPPVAISWWRGVGPAHNVFVVESFIDELAHAAGRDPVEYRLALLKHNPMAANVLQLAAQKAGWGTPLPPGSGRGVSLHQSFGSFVSMVQEVSVSPDGVIRLGPVTAVIDCGQAVNPDIIKAQLEGGILFGLSAALYSGITFTNGRVDQSNFQNYRILRIDETPPVQTFVVQSAEHVGGVGETGTAASMPALGNAIFAAIGKRLRRMPFTTEELMATPSLDKTASAAVAADGLISPFLKAL